MRLRRLVIAALLLFACSAAWADATWTGGGSNSAWDNKLAPFNLHLNWSPAVLPSSSDVVTFGAGFASGTSINLNGSRTVQALVLNTPTSLEFVGGTLTLVGGDITRVDTVGVEGTHSISASLVLQSAGDWLVNGSSSLVISGPISGFGFTKTGAGTVTFAGISTNSYGLATTVNGGLLALARSPGAAPGYGSSIPGPLVINGPGQVDVQANDQIADTSAVTITNGVLSLNNVFETIGSLTLNNGQVTGSSASGSIAFTSPAASVVTSGGSTNAISKRLYLNQGGGASREFNVAALSSLTLGGVIENGSFGSGSIEKTGPGRLVLANSNGFAGGVHVAAGELAVGASDGACGNGPVTVEYAASITGKGRINGVLNIKGGGHLAPSPSNSSLETALSLVLNTDSYLDFSLGTASANKVVAASGNITVFNNVRVNISDSGGLGPDQLYTVLDWTGTSSGVPAESSFVLSSTPIPGGLRVSGKTLQFGTVPGAPADLTAADVPFRSVQLNWNAVVSPTLTSYNVYRSSTSGFTPSPANRIASGLTSNTYLDPSLAPGQPVYYKVTSVGFSGVESPAGNQATATVPASPTTIYVRSGATGANNGASWGDAFKTLSTALSSAISGDRILVAEGTYSPGNQLTSTFSLKSGVAIYGGFPGTGDPGFAERFPVAYPTILTGDIGGGQRAYNVVTASGTDSTAILDGFLIRNGRAYGTPGSNTNVGGGIRILSASPVVANCAFDGNLALVGGGAGILSGSPRFINCAFRANGANYGGAIYFTGVPRFESCTVALNSANQLGGAVSGETDLSTIIFVNSIIHGNTAPTNPQLNLSQGAAALVSYSDVEGGAPGTGNIDANPRFIDLAGGDLRLQPTSVCGDAGSAADLGTDASDMDGDGDKSESVPFDAEMKPRVAGASVDMGAFELASLLAPPAAPANLTATAAGLNQITLDWNSNTEPDLAGYNVYRGTLPDFAVGQATRIATGVQTSDYADSGLSAGITYYYRVTATDTDGGESVPSSIASAQTTGNIVIIYVNADLPAIGDGASWSTAYNSLQSALAAAGAGDQVWVAGGVYMPGAARTDTFAIPSGVKVLGGFPGLPGQEGNQAVRNWHNYPTILSGDIGAPGNNSDNTHNIVTANNTSADTLLDGFTISGGNANVGVYPAVTQSGGGMRIISGNIVVRNCTFSGNNAGVGGGIFNKDGSPSIQSCVFASNTSGGSGGGLSSFDAGSIEVTGCTFSGNSTSHGGGLYLSSAGTVTGCTFTGNRANAGGGLKIAFTSSVQVNQCVFRGNSAEVVGGGFGSRNGGGVYVQQGSPTLTNCVMWGNSATGDGGGVCVENGSPWFVHCTIAGNSAWSGGGIGTYGYQGVLRLRNTIVWTNNNAEWQYRDISWGNDWDVQYSITRLTYPGTGNISATNLNVSFMDSASGDLRINADSVAVDKANPESFSSVDALGLNRPYDGDNANGAQPDIGAYEYHPSVTTLLDARKAPDNVPASLTGVIVSRAFTDFFYLESDNRAHGIRVDSPGHGAAAGQRVTVAGLVKTTSDGERTIEASYVGVTGSGAVAPFSLINRALGGASWLYDGNTGAGQQGVAGGAGLNNIGLLIKTAGVVTASGVGYFYLDDGSAPPDGTGNAGVRVLTYGAPIPAHGQAVVVTGVSSCLKVGQNIQRLIRVSSASDIQTVTP